MAYHETGTWPRWKLYLFVVAALITVMALFFGLGLALWAMILPTRGASTPVTPMPASGEVRGDAWRDELAAQPMLQVPAAAASTPGVSAELAPVLLVPAADAVGPAGVPTGFPHTPEGAVAQLAAIEVTVLEAMSIPTAHDVHAAWSLPGGVSPAEWAERKAEPGRCWQVGRRPVGSGLAPAAPTRP